MDYRDVAQVNFGLVLEDRRSPMEYDPNDFPAPWNRGIELLKNGAPKEDLAKVMMPIELQDAHLAVAKLNGLGEPENFDWSKALREAAHGARFGRELRKIGEQYEQNKPVDLLPLFGKITSMLGGDKSGLKLAGDIDYMAYKPFMKSGYKPIDDIIGGIPSDGPIVIYGLTGIGKSHFAFNFACCWLKAHEEKTAAIYTLEMGDKHYVKRELEMYPEHEEVAKKRLHVSGSVRNIEELVAEVTAARVGMVVIDDMDGLVSESAASEYEKVYRRVKELCRFLEIPVVVLGQPNRLAKTANRFLNTYDIAWSGAGENSAALLIALQRVDPSDKDWNDDRFPITSKDNNPRYFMIFWKSRDGWPVQMGPGAIRLEPNPITGKYKQMWVGDVFQNKLWSPNSGGTTIGKPVQSNSGNAVKFSKRDD